MSRSSNLRVAGGGYGPTSPSLQGLAIITENESLKTVDNIPGISIDDSFLTSDDTFTLKKTPTKPELNQVQKGVKIPNESPCGSRIAVYRHTAVGRGRKKNVGTISGVFRIGDRHFALTAAHIFFDNVESTGSWADSGLYATDNRHHMATHEIPMPKISETYEVVLECYWPNAADPEIHSKPVNLSLGIVAPSILHRRKGPDAVVLPEVVWNDELDWALIELTESAFCQINRLQISSVTSLEIKPPSFDQQAPTGEVLVAAGASGAVSGKGLDVVKGFSLPWSNAEITAWTIDAELTVGDCGSIVVSPTTGVVYGMVVAYDTDTNVTHIVPAPTIFQSILDRYDEELPTLEDMFCIGSPTMSATSTLADKSTEEYHRTPVVRTETNVKGVFTTNLKSFTMQSTDGRKFVRREAFVQWLTSIRRDGILNLDFLLDDAYPRNEMLPLSSGQISGGGETSVIVFSMLYELDKGHLTHLFIRKGLCDSRMPFELSLLNETISYMNIPDADQLIKKIYDIQWGYCPMIFGLEMERDIPPHIIIPVHRKEQINSKGGSSAKIWKVTVLEEFVGPRLREVSQKARFDDLTDKLGHRYHFAVKSSPKNESAHFESEVAALKAFHSIDGMIGYLGNFTQLVTHPKLRRASFSVTEDRKEPRREEWNCILLEYGDYDLDEYFAATQPPVLPIQITQFWQELAGVAEAIAEIHSFSTRRGGVKVEYAGWHADIKPDNILNIKGTFKLADPGFARFERSEKKLTRLAGGTKTFGSPEVHSAQRAKDTPVSQAIDIWSLGCVLSVAATWVILGWPGVTQFQQLRTEALKRLATRMPGNRARSKSRTRSHGRTSSFSIDGARPNLLPESDCFHDGRNLLEEVRHWHAFLRSCVRRSDAVSVQMLDLVDEKMLISRPEERIHADELYAQMRVMVHSSEIHNQDTTPDVVSQILLHTDAKGTSIAPRSSGINVPTGRHERFERSVPSIKSPNLRASNRSVNKNLFPHSPQPPLALSSRMTAASAHSPSTSTVSGEDDKSLILPEQRPPRPFTNIALNELGGGSMTSSLDIPTEKPSGRSRRESALAPARKLSVSQARVELDKKKKVFSFKKKDPYLSEHLENRDVEFLIDNGDTMTKHWKEAKDLVEILSSMVGTADKDGFDLSFTSGPVKLKQKSTSKAVKATMDSDRARPQPDVRTDMAEALDRVLGQVLARLKSRPAAMMGSSRPLKNWTLIVLTDGVWRGTVQPQAVEDAIVRRMHEISRFEGPKFKPRSVTIQFIQFGKDEVATGRLEALDRGLIDYEIPDLIDTEPSDGNVWKMLLGSVNPNFDYADD